MLRQAVWPNLAGQKGQPLRTRRICKDREEIRSHLRSDMSTNRSISGWQLIKTTVSCLSIKPSLNESAFHTGEKKMANTLQGKKIAILATGFF